MSCSKLLKGGYIGSIIGLIKGDTRSLDYGSHVFLMFSFGFLDLKAKIISTEWEGDQMSFVKGESLVSED